jgi:hypothetical protein
MNEPTLHAEPLVFCLRLFSGGRTWGDAYDWAATGTKVSDDTLEIKGATHTVSPAQWRAIRKELNRLGFRKVTFTRIDKAGRVTKHTVR